jgi:hypothetical protein
MTTTTRILHIDQVAAAVRADGIIGASDLQDMAASIDAGELEWVGPGEDVWHAMSWVAQRAEVSAQFVADETIHYLGW